MSLQNSVILELPGIDVVDGLARLRGNEELYRSLLVRFHKKVLESLPQLEKRYANCEWEELGKLVHALIGVSGNIGAKKIYYDSIAMQEACKDQNRLEIDHKWIPFKASLIEVLEGLKKINHDKTE